MVTGHPSILGTFELELPVTNINVVYCDSHNPVFFVEFTTAYVGGFKVCLVVPAVEASKCRKSSKIVQELLL